MINTNHFVLFYLNLLFNYNNRHINIYFLFYFFHLMYNYFIKVSLKKNKILCYKTYLIIILKIYLINYLKIKLYLY